MSGYCLSVISSFIGETYYQVSDSDRWRLNQHIHNESAKNSNIKKSTLWLVMDFMAEGVYYSSACKRCSRNAALALESGNLSGSKAPVYSSDRYRQRVVNSNFVELVSPSFPRGS